MKRQKLEESDEDSDMDLLDNEKTSPQNKTASNGNLQSQQKSTNILQKKSYSPQKQLNGFMAKAASDAVEQVHEAQPINAETPKDKVEEPSSSVFAESQSKITENDWQSQIETRIVSDKQQLQQEDPSSPSDTPNGH